MIRTCVNDCASAAAHSHTINDYFQLAPLRWRQKRLTRDSTICSALTAAMILLYYEIERVYVKKAKIRHEFRVCKNEIHQNHKWIRDGPPHCWWCFREQNACNYIVLSRKKTIWSKIHAKGDIYNFSFVFMAYATNTTYVRDGREKVHRSHQIQLTGVIKHG